MKKRIWLWLPAIILLLAVGYYRIGYKQFEPMQVPASADAILSIDVKRVTNTLIWEYVTSPSWWNFSSDSNQTDKLDWDDVVEIPDYLFVFHPAKAPVSAWFTRLKMEDADEFNKGMLDLGFTAIQQNTPFKVYQSAANKLEVIAFEDHFIIGTALGDEQQILKQIAQELFIEKRYCNSQTLNKITASGNHAQLYLAAQNWLPHEAVIAINFNKTAIYAKGNINWPNQQALQATNLSFHESAFLSITGTNNQWWLDNLNDSIKQKWSTALNFSIDSTLQQPQTQHWIELTDIRTRKDSAISIEFDDNFNEVKKVVVNQVQEPEWFWQISGAGQKQVHHYFVQNKLLQPTDAGWLFVPMPFVKSYQQTVDSALYISASAYKKTAVAYRRNALFLVYLNLKALSPGLKKWLPETFIRQTNHLQSIEILCSKPNDQLLVELKISKQAVDVPLFK